MAELVIIGGAPLRGETAVQGAKNAALPMLAAALLTGQTCVLENVPRLTDVDAACAIARCLGARVAREGTSVSVTAGELTASRIPDEWMRAMRSSILFLAPLLARTGRAECALPGGCALGARPVNLHLEALGALGVQASVQGERLLFRGRLRGGKIALRYPSVGATENAVMAAALAPGESVISGAAREPEIVELCEFLRAMGARITGEGTARIAVSGVPALHGALARVRPDRIVTATYLAAVAAAGGEAVLRGADEARVRPVIEVLRRAGAELTAEPGLLRIRAGALHAPGRIVTAPYPGFPTDAQAPIMAALLRAQGQTQLCETVFSARFSHVPELRRMGAQIALNGQEATITGVAALHGTHLRAHDLRGGAAAAVAALAAEGESRLTGLAHVDRGYEDLTRDLRNLGVNVKRLENSTQSVYTT